MRRSKEVSNKSVLLAYKLWRSDDVSKGLELVTKVGQFDLGNR